MPADFKIGESTITGKYVGQFEGVDVYESGNLGNINSEFSALTIPDRGIITADGVFTSGVEDGKALMQHEFGHILQFNEVGPLAYYSISAPESFASASISSI